MTLKTWLIKHDIRLQTFADHIGCSIYALRKWLNGERVPRPQTQVKIMKATGGVVTGNDWIQNLKKKA